ncbi:MAG: hypothetical protein HOG04_00140 [Nitrospinaceae bacterium]|nr:hypothetical protein [Nitrospinaceae bacterium]
MGSILIMAMILSGCSMGEDIGQFTGSNKLGGDITIGDMPWIPLGLSRDAYLVAEKRMSRFVKVGMPRKNFVQKMKLNPVMGAEWSDRVTSGEGWFTELSRRNKYGDLEVEEFSFGYYKGHRLAERFAVILENGVVRRVARSPWTSEDDPAPPPFKVFSNGNTLNQELKLVSSHYRGKLQSKRAYEKILPYLKKIRVGWTSAEVRLSLGGSLYRLPNGYMYFQESLLWNDGFTLNDTGPLSVVIMPFGYRDDKGRLRKKVIVRAEGGLVTAVYWQPDAPKRKKAPRSVKKFTPKLKKSPLKMKKAPVKVKKFSPGQKIMKFTPKFKKIPPKIKKAPKELEKK